MYDNFMENLKSSQNMNDFLLKYFKNNLLMHALKVHISKFFVKFECKFGCIERRIVET